MIVVIFFMDGPIKNNFTPSWRKNVAFQHFDQLHCVLYKGKYKGFGLPGIYKLNPLNPNRQGDVRVTNIILYSQGQSLPRADLTPH